MSYHCNLIVVIDAAGQHALFCKRRKPPYQGLYNFVGGKVEPGEENLRAAYRELFEETGISDAQIRLTPLMNLEYPLEEGRLEVYAGRLRENFPVHGDENELFWLSLEEDFFDLTRFAGVGNVGHILRILQFYPEALA